MNSAPKNSAFTLIELLVVVAIIAIMAAILFPVFAQAKASAKKANCISNIKNVSLAFTLYVTDYDDMLPSDSYNVGSGKYRLWYALQDGNVTPNTFNFDDGYLQPYLKNTPITDCPSATDVALSYYAPSSWRLAYGVNSEVIFDPGVNISQCDRPAETILIGDAAWTYYLNGTSLPVGVMRSDWLPAFYDTTALHARHSGETAVVGWLDGHAKANKLDYAPFDLGSQPYKAASIRKKNNLGYLLKYPRQQIVLSPVTLAAFNSDWYYYKRVKPAGL